MKKNTNQASSIAWIKVKPLSALENYFKKWSEHFFSFFSTFYIQRGMHHKTNANRECISAKKNKNGQNVPKEFFVLKMKIIKVNSKNEREIRDP